MPEAATANSGVLSKGAAIGRYLVVALVGRGGMGEVYAAYDPELDRKVAVKLLRGHAAGAADAEGRMRLLREAQAIAKLSHPNVVVVYDVGTFKDSVFIAMEFVEGNTVGYWLQAAARPWREVLKVFLAAGRGLGAAHVAGMVHRDFKPDNVMLTKDGQVRVMDFGLARQLADAPDTQVPEASRMQHLVALGEASGEEPDLDATAKLGAGVGAPPGATPGSASGGYLRQKLTQTGALVGTPAYMAPEQFAGTATDARTDQFAFCIALYEALYGHRPFEGDSVITLMTNVVSGTIRAEPAGTLVPARLRKLLVRGLDPDPDRRHASMAELLDALEKDPASQQRRWLIGGATATIFAAALVVGARQLSSERGALCGGAGTRLAGIWELGADSPRKQEIGRIFAAKGKGSARQLFTTVSGLLDTYAERWSAMYRDACEATHVRGEQSAEILDLRMACLGQRLSNVKALTDIFLTADAEVIENAVSAESALPTLERCADVAMLRSVVPPPSDPKTRERVEAVRADVARVRELGDSGKCQEARAAGDEAVAVAKQLQYLPLVAEASYMAGEATTFCRQPTVQVSLLEEAVWAAEASQDDEVAVEASGSAAAYAAERLRDPKTAAFWMRHAEAVLRRLPGHPMLEAYTIVDRGMVDMAEGKYVEDLAEQQRALALKEATLGPLNPDTATSAMNVGVALHELGRDEEAEAMGRRSVESFERLMGPESVRGATALYDWAEALLGLGRTGEARAAFERAISIWTRLGADPYMVAAGQADLARVDVAEKRPADARRRLEGALPILSRGDAQLAAEANVTLAEALWTTRRERKRAVGLARSARKDLAAAGAPSTTLARVDAWTKSHAAP